MKLNLVLLIPLLLIITACGDVDSDKDGVIDSLDSFPNDPHETTDTDGDSVGDNADAFPFDSNESIDTDGDGVGDGTDAFINDPTEFIDSDGDGIGDNSDSRPCYNEHIVYTGATIKNADKKQRGNATANDSLATDPAENENADVSTGVSADVAEHNPKKRHFSETPPCNNTTDHKRAVASKSSSASSTNKGAEALDDQKIKAVNAHQAKNTNEQTSKDQTKSSNESSSEGKDPAKVDSWTSASIKIFKPRH